MAWIVAILFANKNILYHLRLEGKMKEGRYALCRTMSWAAAGEIRKDSPASLVGEDRD